VAASSWRKLSREDIEDMMDHEEAVELLPAYLDRELGVAEAIAVERHLGGCAECQAQFATQSSVSEQLKRDAAHFRAPGDLAQRIIESLPRQKTVLAVVDPSRRAWLPGRKAASNWNLNWMGAGAFAVSALALVWSGSLFLALPSELDRQSEEVVSSHVRALQVDHLADVASTDKHTVKPWFNGKLDYSPPVVDLAAQDFPLEGGRLDYLNGRTVAALVYRHRKHPINLYVWPSADADALPKEQDRQGYHLVRWTSGGMKYWAISDLATSELEDFVQTLRTKV
jgi:anti-sigma factor RsiW